MRHAERLAAGGTWLVTGLLAGLIAAGVLAGAFLPRSWSLTGGTGLALVSLGLILGARAWLRRGDD